MKVRAAAFASGLLLLVLALSGPAMANSTEGKWRAACWKDAFSFCPLRAIGGDRAGVRDCLVRNIDRISHTCRTVIREAHDQGVTGTEAPAEPATAAPANTAH